MRSWRPINELPASSRRRSMSVWVVMLLSTLVPALGASADVATDSRAGQNLYRHGVLPSGAPLRGEREGGVYVEGIGAACITCHRSSGLGTTEGRIVVPPIIGKYLFRAHSTNVQDLSLPHVAGYRTTREPYTEATLARAISEGVAPNGRALNFLMPRYALDEPTMASTIQYLKELSAGDMPGVGDGELHFATIITPDADPVARQGMLDVMRRFFEDKNSFIRGGIKPMQATREIEYRISRRWVLHVWELTGPPEQWERELREHFVAEPVFAVISGLGHGTWAPVHHFCEAQRVPCLFPNISLPVVAETDFYPVYFSRGVLLEADLMTGRILDERAGKGIRHVIQVFRKGDVGENAAGSVAEKLNAAGFSAEERVLAADADSHALAAALRGVGEHDALVLWLRPGDLARLPSPAPACAVTLISGELGNLELAPLPAAWRQRTLMTYPVDLPELRKVRMNFPLAWFNIRHIPVVDERVQTDTYVALGILAETLTDMLDSFVPDYLLERVEIMLSHRLVNGYYPRLSLAPGQRFASKGGYVVRFAGTEGHTIAADGDWTVP